MAKAKEKIAAVEAVPEPTPEITPEPAEEEKTIADFLLFERIPEYRFVDENGRVFRMELRSSGVYWLYPV